MFVTAPVVGRSVPERHDCPRLPTLVLEARSNSLSCAAVFLAAVCLASSLFAGPSAHFPQRHIKVDGDLSDWNGIPPIPVHGSNHLWFGQGMTPDKWQGDADLSYQWRGAWEGNRLFFAVEVNDDRVMDPQQAASYLCDCVEIYLDYNNQGGRRVQVLDGRADWFSKCDPKELRGYELHFLPANPPRVYLDHSRKYVLDQPQTRRFKHQWAGQVAFKKTAQGYVMELGFSVPGVTLQPGKVLGLELGVCDDDGTGRESIMMWTGTLADFWLTMDEYGQAVLDGSPQLKSRQNADGSWGLEVAGAGLASAGQAQPMQLELWDATNGFARAMAAGYHTLKRSENGLVGKGKLVSANGAAFEFEDRWHLQQEVLRLERRVRVQGNAPGGFLSAALLQVRQQQTWPEVQWFAPGMLYGGFDHLSANAIGGRAYYQPGAYTVRIREDRLPAPLLAGLFHDASTLAVLNPAPLGDTFAEDGESVRPGTLIDERLRFGAVGGEERSDGLSLGCWFPGSEGEETYQGNTYPGGQLHQWRRRFHPIRDQFEQRYSVCFRFGHSEGFAASTAEAWRWAWDTLQPQVNPQDLAAARKAIVDVLATNVIEVEDRAGIPNALPSVPTANPHTDAKTVMGFTGKALEAAEFMLAESLLDSSERGTELRRKAEKIIASFLRLKMAPPQGEGFFIQTGQPTTALEHQKDPQIYLRSFGDDVKALLRACQREQRYGRQHPEWLAWARSFADWALTQQRRDGSLPRTWLPGTGQVASESSSSTFNIVPLLTLMFELTHEERYLAAALRAGEFSWKSGQQQGIFVGGTIDNPDVLDKEAATLSLEAYLALYRCTHDSKWLRRAGVAADLAETWIYIWNVPMPADADNASLHWKRGVPTTGLQLIASGHSLTDAYMSFDVDEYAALYQLNGDAHYLEVARLLLHNTKAMVALPGRCYDLKGPGWQQEHYSLAPRRGFGLHRLWLPWVATSQLNGIFGLMDLDPELFRRLASAP
jgi:hypothetical protein